MSLIVNNSLICGEILIPSTDATKRDKRKDVDPQNEKSQIIVNPQN